MTMQFTVLASGSAGNTSLVQIDGYGVLIDAGLGPRQLAARLERVGADWSDVHAVVLSHTHGDHWRERTLAQFAARHVPLYCHPLHGDFLEKQSQAFRDLAAVALVRCYEPGVEWQFPSEMRCRAISVSHDSPGTCGFRFEGRRDFLGHAWSLGYAADLGCWTAELVSALSNVDILALEFNHDITLERASGRSAFLIARVLGAQGHLSNEQARELLEDVLRESHPGRLRHLVQLHLSRDCNSPALARSAAKRSLADFPHLKVHTARQHHPGPRLRLSPRDRLTHLHARPQRVRNDMLANRQPWLPGWEDALEALAS